MSPQAEGRLPQAEGRLPQAEGRLPQAEGRPIDPGGALILIVEDNEKNRKLVRDVLQFKGYRTVETETAEEGLRVAKESMPALILMDIQLPGMDGIQALQHLRADAATREIPVIAVTASAMTHDRQKIMAAGFDGYQAKPINVKGFIAAVAEMLGRRGKGGPGA